MSIGKSGFMNLFKSIIERFLRIVIIPKEKTSYVLSGDFLKDTTETKNTDTGCVIIGALKNPRQLSVCIKNNFYHIPVSVAGDDGYKAEYVAIYQSRNLFGRMSGIEFYGKIKNKSVVPRYKIKEIPKYSNDMYFRFAVEKWEKLEKRIVPDGSGVICEYTTLEKLKSADKISELLKNEDAEK